MKLEQSFRDFILFFLSPVTRKVGGEVNTLGGEMSPIFSHQTHQLAEKIVPRTLIYTFKGKNVCFSGPMRSHIVSRTAGLRLTSFNRWILDLWLK